MGKVITMRILHRNQKRILLKFHFNPELTDGIKNIPGRTWSKTHSSWHVPDTRFAIERLLQLGVEVEEAEDPIKKLHIETQEAFIKYIEYLQWKRLSPNTQTSYKEATKKFLCYYADYYIEEITTEQLNSYLYYLITQGVSASTQNIFVSAIKMFYTKMYNKNIDIMNIERPIRSKPLPKVIARHDVEKMLLGITNLKHQTALLVIYSLGLRRSELLNLELSDIDSKRMVIVIRNAKGNKDRTVPLSEKMLERLKAYYWKFRPRKYLIEGNAESERYTATSLSTIFHRYMDRVRPNNNFTLHCLRHSCATHLLEEGTDIRYIQELLGHKSTRTTEIYTHVSVRSLRNIKPPGDDFNI
jgi:integrase/recombinase XerD